MTRKIQKRRTKKGDINPAVDCAMKLVGSIAARGVRTRKELRDFMEAIQLIMNASAERFEQGQTELHESLAQAFRDEIRKGRKGVPS
jgi:hypothetical protein